MGKFEVLDYLSRRRQSGDEEYYRYAEVHEGLRREGTSLSYTSVWRSLNSLFIDGLLEVVFESEGLQRAAKFRGRSSTSLQSSQVKRVHNILRGTDQNSGRGAPGGEISAAQAGTGAAKVRGA